MQYSSGVTAYFSKFTRIMEKGGCEFIRKLVEIYLMLLNQVGSANVAVILNVLIYLLDWHKCINGHAALEEVLENVHVGIDSFKNGKNYLSKYSENT